jgi:hypothetical protein
MSLQWFQNFEYYFFFNINYFVVVLWRILIKKFWILCWKFSVVWSIFVIHNILETMLVSVIRCDRGHGCHTVGPVMVSSIKSAK